MTERNKFWGSHDRPEADEFLKGDHPSHLTEHEAQKLGDVKEAEMFDYSAAGETFNDAEQEPRAEDDLRQYSKAQKQREGNLCRLLFEDGHFERNWKIVKYYPKRDEYLVLNEVTQKELRVDSEKVYDQ